MVRVQTESSVKGDDVPAQRRWLERRGKLHQMHWLVVGLSVLLTLVAWRYANTLVETRAQQRFERAAERIVASVANQLGNYASELRATASFMVATEAVSLDAWRVYSDALQLETRYPALRALGVALHASSTVGPPDFRPASSDSLPISRVWPREYEANAIGLDLLREPVRNAAYEGALISGTPRLTSRVPLGVSGKPGLVMLYPFDAADGPGSDAQTDARGAVVGVLLASHLLADALDESERSVSVLVRDADDVVYSDGGFASVDANARFRDSRTVEMFGREWVFETRSTPTFYQEAMITVPTFVLLAGLLIDALLILLFGSLAHANRRALRFAANAGKSLEREREELAHANRELSTVNDELGRLGHALSHDLKTPLNGVQTLIEFIEEDLTDAALDDEMRVTMAHHLARMRSQVGRGKSLIRGMMQYSGLGSEAHCVTRVDTRALLLDIGEGLDIAPDRLRLPHALPTIDTCETRLRQVFGNLVGNAVKYHPDPRAARIEIDATEREGWIRFAVSDDGPGIDPAHRERIFELFKTLQPKDHIESSGVGLAIVRKVVLQSGGAVSVDRAPLGGARFEFTWPVQWPTRSPTPSATQPTNQTPAERPVERPIEQPGERPDRLDRAA